MSDEKLPEEVRAAIRLMRDRRDGTGFDWNSAVDALNARLSNMRARDRAEARKAALEEAAEYLEREFSCPHEAERIRALAAKESADAP